MPGTRHVLRRRNPPPCQFTRCEKGTFDNPKTFYPINRRAFEHWQECRAVGVFPDDDIVRRHAAVLHELERLFRNFEQDRLLQELAQATCVR